MTVKQQIKKLANFILKPYGHELTESHLLYDWQKSSHVVPENSATQLPSGAPDYLRTDHPRLKELLERYARFDNTVTAPSVWTDDLLDAQDIKQFRGDNAYVWQLRGQNMAAINYALTMYYVKSIDKLRLLEKLQEDNYFGAYTFLIDNKVISRDLLDSIVEIGFLERHLNLSSRNSLSVLDIGAGYGRLAHRMTSALPNISSYLCTDAVAQSTFVSEYYLQFRKPGDTVKVVPLDEISTAIADRHVDLAVNIHSFSECRVPAINWWLSLLAENRVKHLMIIPNAGLHGGRSLWTNDGQDIQQVVEGHGYRLIAKDPKYSDPIVQQYGLNPTYCFLFELPSN